MIKLRLEEISKNFDQQEVLNGINYTFAEGVIYALLGRNGAGKTTLFNIISDEIKADTGYVFIEENEETRKVKPEEVGFLLSEPRVPEFLTGRELIKFYLDVNKVENKKTIDEYFDMVSLDVHDRDKLMKNYSTGMKNKISLLLHLINSSKIFLLDEPLTSFDVIVAEEMKTLLKSLKNDRVIIFSTHIMELALDLCDRVVVLNNGYLHEIDKESLDNSQFKQKIIDALQEY